MPPPIANPSFEDDDGGGVLPDAWTQTVLSTAVDICDFGDDGSGMETFETGWAVGDFLSSFAPGDVESATFDTALGPKPYEPFDKWGGVDGFFFALPSTEVAIFGVDAFDSFDAWITLISSFAGTACTFDDGLGGFPEFDAFDGGWKDNEVVYTSMPAATECTFSPGAALYEDFESSLAPNRFTVDVANNRLLTAVPHTLVNGDLFTTAISDTDELASQLPKGLQPNTTYVAIVISATRLQATLDGVTVIDILDQGSGTFVLLGDATKYWTTFTE